MHMITKKKAPSMEVWMSLTVALGFRDKAIKIIQYGSLILQWYYQHGTKETKAKILAARMGASMARKGFRMFRTLNHVCEIAKMISNWRALVERELRDGQSPMSLICREDTAIEVAEFFENFFYGLYYYFDNILYFGRTKIIDHDDLLNCDRANVSNFGADVASLIGSILKVRKSARCKHELEMKIKQIKEQQIEQEREEQQLQQRYDLSSTTDICRCEKQKLKMWKEKREGGESKDEAGSYCAYCYNSVNFAGTATSSTSEDSREVQESKVAVSSEVASQINLGYNSSSSGSSSKLHLSTPSNEACTPVKSTGRGEAGTYSPFHTVASKIQSPTQKKSLFAPTPTSPFITPTESSLMSTNSSQIVSNSHVLKTQLVELEKRYADLSNDQDKLIVEGLINLMEVMVSANFSPMNFWSLALGENRFTDAHEGICGVLSSIFVIYNLWPNREN